MFMFNAGDETPEVTMPLINILVVGTVRPGGIDMTLHGGFSPLIQMLMPKHEIKAVLLRMIEGLDVDEREMPASAKDLERLFNLQVDDETLEKLQDIEAQMKKEPGDEPDAGTP